MAPGGSQPTLDALEELLDLGDPLALLDADFRVVRVNAPHERLSRLPRDRTVGHLLWEVWPETAAPHSRLGNELRRCMAERTCVAFDDLFEPTKTWVNVRVTPTASGGLAVVFRDVTAERQARLERVVSEERLRLLVEHAPTAIALFDREMRYLAHSRRYLAEYRLPHPTLVGLKHYDVFPEIPERWREIHRRALAGEPARSDEERFERADGTVEWVQWEIVPWLDSRFEVGGFVLFTENVTRYRQAQEALARQLEVVGRTEEQLRQAQKMEAVGRLAGGIAHDFNNVLTVILAGADFIAASLPEGHELRFEAEEIRKAGQRASALTRQLLAFSRKQASSPRPIDLNTQLAGLEPLVRRLVGEEVELRLRWGEGLPPCLVDPGQLEQVVLNLVINARDAMPEGGELVLETGRVELTEADRARHSEARPGPHVRLSVRDTGVGMPAEVMEHVFEPFFTTKEFGKGTGLGLAMVYGIVQQHGGTIELQSEVGRGTTFRVTFPVAGGEVRAERPRSSAPRPAPTEVRETVLLAEDEPQVRASIAAMLRRAGFQVLEAADGEEALEVARRHAGPLGLLVSDVKMPKLGGAPLAERLAAERAGVPVLFMSGYGGDDLDARKQLPADAQVVSKPFSAEELLERVDALLGQRRR